MCKGETDVEKPSTSSVVQKEHKHIELVQTEEKIEFQPVTSPSSQQKSPTESVDVPVHSNEHLSAKNLLTVRTGFSFCCMFMISLWQEEKPHPSPNSGKKSTGVVLSQNLSLEAQVQQLKYENDKLKNALTTR